MDAPCGGQPLENGILRNGTLQRCATEGGDGFMGYGSGMDRVDRVDRVDEVDRIDLTDFIDLIDG